MKDIRDLRDPQTIGEKLLEQTPLARGAYGDDIPMSEVWDVHVSNFSIPNYDSGPYMSAPPEEHHMYGFDFSDTEPGGD